MEILTDINTISKKWRTPINNNGGGYVNHIIYWSTMCKPPNPPPSSVLLALIDDSFGSFDNFKHHFTEKALKLFGSGYVWLCLSGNSTSLTIKTTPNQVCVHLIETIRSRGLQIIDHYFYEILGVLFKRSSILSV